MKKIKFKLFLLACATLFVITMFILVWSTYHAAKEQALKEGEVYVVDGTEIYVAGEEDYSWVEKEIKEAVESEGALYIDKEKAEELGMVFYPGTFTAPTSIIIDGEEEAEICVLDWSTGKLEFRGKMSCSARSFFKYFLKPYVDEYITEELDKKKEVFKNEKNNN